MAGLSKSRILAHRQCPKRLWLQIYKPELIVTDDATEARFAAGTHVGEVARGLHPDGLLIDHDDLKQCLADTAQALAATPRPIFEATLQFDGVLIRADLLLPEEDGYRLVEVKSSASVKAYHYDDAAVQAWVTRQAGIPLTRVEIAHIDTSFVYPGVGDYRGLLKHADITDPVSILESQVGAWAAAARTTLSGAEPVIESGEQCHTPFECPFLAHCQPVAENVAGCAFGYASGYASGYFPPEILPYGKQLAAALRAEGFNDLRDVPADRLQKAKHQRIWRATVSQQAEIDSAAGQQLAALPYPRFYLDFETIHFAVPIWAGTRPYRQIPFQWSCHIESAPDVIAHHAFLAEDQNDPRRDFAESLLKVLDKSFLPTTHSATFSDAGPIFVYNQGFENARIKELATAFPDLAPALHAAIARVVDLLPLTRDHYYHPDMRGSWSIKAVLPTIAPELAYDQLSVADGGMAQEAFLETMQPQTTPERRTQLRQSLLDYCARDTWAMVRLTQFFTEHQYAER